MSLYQLPHLNQAVTWLPEQPRTVLRYIANGGLVLLHATQDPALTPKRWISEALELGLVGTSLAEQPEEVPPVLCVRLADGPVLAAPACLLELGEPTAIYEWLNARAEPADLRLVLLRLSPERPGVAVLEASRRVWAKGWATGDVLLRLRLEQQCLRTEPAEAGQVQHTGRELVAGTPAQSLMDRAEFRMNVAG